MGFRNRVEAGRALAKKLMVHAGRQDVLVLALPCGGVPVAYEVATALQAPLDIFIVHKLGVPGREDLALGAVTSGGVRVFNHDVKHYLRVREPEIEAIGAREQKEVERRERFYRGDQPGPEVRGRTVILVDDGLASGAEMQAAVMALRLLQPARLIVAVPVLPVPVSEMWLQEADACVSVIAPTIRDSAGHWYADLPQTTDREVQALLQQALGINPTGFDETRAL
jgi:putative phosphoribosyl transferase